MTFCKLEFNLTTICVSNGKQKKTRNVIKGKHF